MILIITLFGVIVCLMLILLLAFPYVVGGLRVVLGKIKYKQNAGLIFLQSQANNFSFPYVCDTRSKTFDIKIEKEEYKFPLSRDLFQDNGTFFGMPYAMFPVEDCKNAIGLYYQESDENGEPLYYTNADGVPIIPRLSKVKTGVSLRPNLIKAIVGDMALTEALAKLFKDNQLAFYLIIGNILVSAVSVYFLYDLTSTTLPNITGSLQTIIGILS